MKIEENSSEDPDRETLKLTGPKRIFASLFGVAGGVLAGVFGLSGTPPISAGLYSLGLPTIMVVGTTVFVLVFNFLAGIGGIPIFRQIRCGVNCTSRRRSCCGFIFRAKTP